MLRNPFLLALPLAALALAACQGPAPVTPPAKADERVSKKPAAPVQAVASALPALAADFTTRTRDEFLTRTRADFVTRGRLLPPAGANLALSGTVKLDVAYVLASGAGRLVGQDGGTIAPETLVGQDGGTIARLVMTGAEPDGAPVVTADAARLISDNGIGIISGNGASLISDNGAALISDNGIGLISDNGALLISDNGIGLISDRGLGASPFLTRTRYRLAQAAAPAPSVAAGGMRVAVLDLTTGRPVPLGRDAAGQPVLATYTDRDGGWQAFLPADLAGNVVVVARAPDRDDPRLELGRLAAAEARPDLALDDGEALATAHFRTMLVGQIDGLVAQDTAGSLFPPRFSAQIPAALRDRAEAVVARLRGAYTAAGLQTLPPSERRYAVQDAVDALCARVAFADVPIDTTNTAYKGPGGPAMPALARTLQAAVDGARAKLAQDPAWFDQRPYMREANAARRAAGRPEVKIERATDAAAFLVVEYLSATDQDQQERGDPLWADLGLDAARRLELRGVIYGLYMAVGLPLLADEAAVDALVARFAAVRAEIDARKARP